MTASHEAHKWEFKARFRRHAFGWKSQPAIQRVKQAVSEIGKVARVNPVLAAEGAVTLLERLSPALENVLAAEENGNAAEIRGRIQKLVAGERAGGFVVQVLGKDLGR